MSKIKELYFYYDFFKFIYNDHPVDMVLNTISGCARLLNTLKRELMKNRFSRLTQFQLGY